VSSPYAKPLFNTSYTIHHHHHIRTERVNAMKLVWILDPVWIRTLDQDSVIEHKTILLHQWTVKAPQSGHHPIFSHSAHHSAA
jgi:hypothetical protein